MKDRPNFHTRTKAKQAKQAKLPPLCKLLQILYVKTWTREVTEFL